MKWFQKCFVNIFRECLFYIIRCQISSMPYHTQEFASYGYVFVYFFCDFLMLVVKVLETFQQRGDFRIIPIIFIHKGGDWSTRINWICWHRLRQLRFRLHRIQEQRIYCWFDRSAFFNFFLSFTFCYELIGFFVKFITDLVDLFANIIEGLTLFKILFL